MGRKEDSANPPQPSLSSSSLTFIKVQSNWGFTPLDLNSVLKWQNKNKEKARYDQTP